MTGPRSQSPYVAALAGLPGMGPSHLVRILGRHPPDQAWAEVRAGRIERPPARAAGAGPAIGPDQPPLFRSTSAPAGAAGRADRRRPWSEVAGRIDPPEWWRPMASAGIGVTWPGQPDYPASLEDDPAPPGALFWKGRIDSLERKCVAIIGTRNATPDGRSIAFELGRDLAAAGLCVVSGLALGIDGAAHAGAVAAVRHGAEGRTVGVAASGVDVPYPRRHVKLWREVIESGAILSENLPGRPAQAWRFPTRNRIIAGLVQMVVVVESHQCGGSLITAEAAIERGVDVRVVPGPVHSPASAGSNQLLYDGPGPVRHARDVLDALGLFRPDPPPPTPHPPPPSRRGAAASGGADPIGLRVLDALGWRPASTSRLMARSGLDSATLLRVLDRLGESGQVVCEGGWWVRKV